MKKEELRIGNLIDIEGHIEPVSVYWLECMEEYPGEMRHYKGIPLTDLWMESFGFKEDTIFGINVKYKIGCFEVWYSTEAKTFMVENIKNMRVFVKYVHQLQNLYFALTGEELKRTESCKQ